MVYSLVYLTKRKSDVSRLAGSVSSSFSVVA